MNPNKIVACIKQSQLSPYITDYAAWIASQLEKPLEFFHIKNDSNIISNTTHNNALFETYCEQAITAGIAKTMISTFEKDGDLVTELNRYQTHINLLVIGRHCENDHKASNKIKHNNTPNILRNVQCPILSVTQPFTIPSTAMIAFNGSDSSKKLIKMLAQSNLFKSIPLYLVMSGKENEERQEELVWAHQTLEKSHYDVTSSFIMGGGNIEDTIIRTVQEQSIDLLIMGAFGHHSLYHMIFGSKTIDLLKHLQIPILHLR